MRKAWAVRSSSKVCGVAAWVLLSAGCAVAAPVSYLIGVDTSTVNGTPGFLDFQFNPGVSPTQAAIATVSNFTGGTLISDPTVAPPLLPSPQLAGGASGSLQPGPLTIANSTAFNDFFQQIVYGKFLSFVLELTGPALDSPDLGNSPSGSIFGLTLFAATGLRAILTNGAPPGPVVTVNVNPDTSTVVTPFLNGGDPSVVTFEQVPEPGSMLLLTFGTAGLVFLRKILR